MTANKSMVEGARGGPRHFSATHYDAAHSTGPLRSLNTTTHYHPLSPSPGAAKEAQSTAAGTNLEGQETYWHVWRSRDNRKGRHAVVVSVPDDRGHGGKPDKAPTNTPREVLKGIGKMVTRWPVWDVSWQVAVVFTLGSVIWCVNGCFAYLPLAAPSTEFEGETDVAATWLAFVGATVFEWGSVLMMLEAVNENRGSLFFFFFFFFCSMVHLGMPEVK